MKRLIVFLLLVSTSAALGAQVYVSTDKGAYVAGDRIWCSVFCAPGPAVAYIELISTESVAARTRVDVRSGRGGGSLTVPFGTPTGKYRLVAYTDPSEADASSGPVLTGWRWWIPYPRPKPLRCRRATASRAAWRGSR